MSPWTQIMLDLHESQLMVVDGEPINPEYTRMNALARDGVSLTVEQHNELFYKMAKVLHNELMETMPRTKDLMGYLVEGLTQ